MSRVGWIALNTDLDNERPYWAEIVSDDDEEETLYSSTWYASQREAWNDAFEAADRLGIELRLLT